MCWQKKQHILASLRKAERNNFVPSGLATGVFEELPKDFETFAAGYFLGLGIKKPTAEDICRLSVDCRAFAAALSFYMFTDPYVLSKVRTPDKYEAVAKNIRCFIEALP